MSKDLNLSITGEATIYRSDKFGYPLYSIKLSNQIDGVWENDFMQVGLPKGAELQNNTKIQIKHAFFSFYKKSTNEKVHKLIVTSYDIIDQAVGDIDIPNSDVVNFDTDLPW